MRHGEAFRPGMDVARKAHASSLTSTGLGDAKAVGHRLADSVGDLALSALDVTVACATSPQARDTAAAVAAQLDQVGGVVVLKSLDLAAWTADPEQDPAEHWNLIEKNSRGGPLMRSQPSSSHMTRRRAGCYITSSVSRVRASVEQARCRSPATSSLSSGAEPKRTMTATLPMTTTLPMTAWCGCSLSPSDSGLVDELHAKIKSKMDAAKLLGTFVTAVLLFAARELSGAVGPPWWYQWVAGLGVALLTLATAAYFVTMFRYDELLMPVRMWPSPRPSKRPLPRGFVARPPSSAGWVLYENMMRIWFNAFVPATLLGGGGAIAVTIALARPDGLWWLAVGLSMAGVVLVTMMLLPIARPTLGVSD